MDYARFCEMLLRGGQLNGVRVLAVDSAIDALPAASIPVGEADALQKELSDIKAAAMRRLSANGLVTNANLVPQLFSGIADSRVRLEFLRGKT